MPILLTDQQWADVQNGTEVPARVLDPTHGATFVLLRAEVYDRFKSLFEADPITDEERLYQLQQFGRRAGWGDPEMDVYNELDPRRTS
jgi:hypothetical protein